MKKALAILLACSFLLASAPMAYAQAVHADGCREAHMAAGSGTGSARGNDFPFDIEIREVQTGCTTYTRRYTVCRACGVCVSWTDVSAVTIHKGLSLLKFCGYDTDGTMIFKMQCNACGAFE